MPKGDYQCDRCSSYFSIYSALERHMEAHSLADTLGKQDSSQGEGDGLNIREYKVEWMPKQIIFTSGGISH